MRITNPSDIKLFQTYYGVLKKNNDVQVDGFYKNSNIQSAGTTALNKYEAVFSNKPEADKFAQHLKINMLL